MPRYKKNPKDKAVAKSFALHPKDLEILEFLSQKFHINHSKVIQRLLKNEYIKLKEDINE